MKTVLVINGHPKPNSFCHALNASLRSGLRKSNVEFDEIFVGEIQFDLNLHGAYGAGQALEKDLLECQLKIVKADHIVWIFPLWWDSLPAISKAFVDRVFTPDFAFRLGRSWNKSIPLLNGRTMEIICTTDYPNWYYRWVLKSRGVKAFAKVLQFTCGIRNLNTTLLGPMRSSSPKARREFLRQVEKRGASCAR